MDDHAPYIARTAKSGALFKRASKVLVGGMTRTSVYFPPYPAFMVKGEGCRTVDVDGNVYVDFINNYTTLIHGYSFAPITAALQRQAAMGSCFGAPSEHEIQLAELIVERVASIEKMRFASSGTEAVMYALRLARLFTGRNTVAKFEGGFHGAYDDCQVSYKLTAEHVSEAAGPVTVLNSAGLEAGVGDRVVVLPFNQIDAACAAIDAQADHLACVIVEPVIGAGGVIPADRKFLEALRERTAHHGILLIFDEIMSFRLGYGGAQQIYGITPDLTTLGKIISGGLPLAAFGGREEVMAPLDPTAGPPLIPQSGTFNGCAAAAAAGTACMEHLTREKLSDLDALGQDLKHGLEQLFRRTDTEARVTGFGSLFNIHFSAAPVEDHRGVVRADQARMERLFRALLLRGQCIAPRGMICLSTVMGKAEIDGFIDAVSDALASGEV